MLSLLLLVVLDVVAVDSAVSAEDEDEDEVADVASDRDSFAPREGPSSGELSDTPTTCENEYWVRDGSKFMGYLGRGHRIKIIAILSNRSQMVKSL